MDTKDFKGLVDLLVIANERSRADALQDCPIWKKLVIGDAGHAGYAKRFCTIRIDLGRECGKTSYIMEYQSKAHSSYRKGIALTTSMWFKNNDDYDDVICVNGGNVALPCDRDFRYIYIDEPDLVFSVIDKDSVYACLVRPDIEQTFILLG